MTINKINNTEFADLSDLSGVSLATLSHVNGLAIEEDGPPTADIWAWWEPSREVGYVDNDPITPLTDQSGNARNWTQATLGSRPLYDTTNALNGLAVTTFNTDRYWDGPDLTPLGVGTGAGKESHLFAIIRADADPAALSTDTGLWKLSTASDATVYAFTDNNTYDSGMKGTRNNLGNPAASLAAWRVYEISMLPSSIPAQNDGAWIVRFDGTQQGATVTIVGAGPNATPTLGRNSLGWGFKGKMAGLYIYSTVLGSSERSAVISYINGRFALSSS